MRRIVLGVMLGVLVAILLGPMATRSDAQGLLLVQLTPVELQQGRTSVIRVTAPPDITRIEILFDGVQTPLYRTSQGDWGGFVAADMDSARGETPLQVLSWQGDEPRPPQSELVNVVWGAFLFQDIQISGALEALLDPQLNADEENTLLRIFRRYTPQKLWTGPFAVPVPGQEISEFGGIRNFNNGVLEGRHTGVDFRAGTGELALAAADGRVVFAGFLPIRGNHVVVEHGIGVFTGYSHLSEIMVVPGQRILQGDTLGLVGATGRVQGAHMHFEVSVNGSWVDPLQFMSLPAPEQGAARSVGG